MLYKKKPVIIEAVQWLGDFSVAVEFMLEREDVLFLNPDGTLDISTMEGTMKANHGDWIIRGVKGEHYPCKPDIFEMTYEPASA